MKKTLFCLLATMMTATLCAASNDSIITYTAPAKLVEQASTNDPGFHPSVFNNSNPVVEHTFSNGVGKIAFSAKLTLVNGYAFYGDSTLETITLPNTVTKLGSSAFCECKNLKKVNFPKSLTHIEMSCFTACTSLDTIKLNDALVTIEASVFSRCTGLKEVIISSRSNLDKIGSAAFNGCSGIFSLYIPLKVSTIAAGAFSGICNVEYTGSATGKSYWGNKVLNGDPRYPLVYDSNRDEILGCAYDAEDTIVLESTVKYIAANAFKDCNRLTAIVMKNILTIGNQAFKNCTELNMITCRMATPATCGSNAFENVDKTIPVYVPAGSESAYAAEEGWKDFFVQPIPTDMTNLTQSQKNDCRKYLKDGKLWIEREGVIYSVSGQK